MPFIHDDLLTNGLADLAGDTGLRLDICHTAEPTTYTQATSTNSCGNETGITAGSVVDNAGDGLKVIIPAVTDGDVTASQTAAYWAVTDGTSKLWATGTLSAPQAVISGNKFTLDAIDIAITDAV